MAPEPKITKTPQPLIRGPLRRTPVPATASGPREPEDKFAPQEPPLGVMPKPKQLDYKAKPGRVFIFGATPQLPGGRLMSALDLKHQWIVTSDQQVGMGNRRGVPGENGQSSPDMPFSPTYTVDHRGRRPEVIREVQGVDLPTLKTWLEVGQPLGPWTPLLNDCNTFAERAVRESTPHTVIPQSLRRAIPGADALQIPLSPSGPTLQNVVRRADGTYRLVPNSPR